jgi:hypothetical protein
MKPNSTVESNDFFRSFGKLSSKNGKTKKGNNLPKSSKPFEKLEVWINPKTAKEKGIVRTYRFFLKDLPLNLNVTVFAINDS